MDSLSLSSAKLNRIEKFCTTARYPRTFRARLANIDPFLIDRLTAKEVAAIIDGPMQRSYAAGHSAGYGDAK